ncbi:MAG: ADP-ribosylglycohydrolase family protein [Paramuribaculum sp.]|nr:ADP-ribosylglycohydrolase family protein [Paramuribaculum sp.]
MVEIEQRKHCRKGALMRTSILGILPNYEPRIAEDVCKLTHYDPRCIGSCVLLCSLIYSLIYDNIPMSYNQILQIADIYDSRIREYTEKAKEDDFAAVTIDNPSMGYTLTTLFVALWTYFHAPSFEEGLLTVVNAGGDADTNAAVACSLLGAKFGFNTIPEYYWKNLYQLSTLINTTQRLLSII